MKVCGLAATREEMARGATLPRIAISRLTVNRRIQYQRLIGHRVLLFTDTLNHSH